MKGENEIRKQELNEDGALQVHEVFTTIQGEGPLAGYRAVFVRLTGCMLQCRWCDTEWDDKDDKMFTVPELVETILRSIDEDSITAKFGAPWIVVLTGGDPMRQNIVPLISSLKSYNLHVQIETAGVYWVPDLERFVVPPEPTFAGASIVCSPKTGRVHEKVAELCTDWKYIICDGEVDMEVDGLPLLSTQHVGIPVRLYRPTADSSTIYVQPCEVNGDKWTSSQNLKATIASARKFGYRISLQQHKLMGVP